VSLAARIVHVGCDNFHRPSIACYRLPSAFHRPAIELPSPSIDGSPSPYNPRPMETGLYGLEALGRHHRV